MPLSVGTRLGTYEILGAIGSGGMGTVYRARDTRLNRYVAIKVLTDRISGNALSLARLQREAQVLAALNHPHIATIHGLEETPSTGSGQAGMTAIVMELVEGEDLKQRLVRGPVPLDEVLPIARQIADALEAAHGQGIVHRDLKPANVKVRADGTAKVLDFGLAKAAEPMSSSSDPAFDDSPTITSPAMMTTPGMLLGTAAYMAPEQARGKVVDKRADIWAFGCLLYEMLTGRLAFTGDTISDTIASILQREPQWEALPAETPIAIRRLLRRCLEKDPKRRLHDIADARIEIDEAISPTREAVAVAPPLHARSSRLWTWAAGLVAVIAAGVLGWFLRSGPAVPEVRLDINTPPTTDSSLAVSSDGSKVVFVAKAGKEWRLWLRSLDSSSAQPLPGTERASTPFWSPDGRSLGFFADTRLKRMDIASGATRTLWSQSAVPIGGTWNRDDVILFADNPGGPIFRISANGGERTAATLRERPQQRGHHYPQFLPDGRHFLFFVSSNSPEARGVYVGLLDTLDAKRVVDADAPATFAASGQLLFIRGDKLYAQRFDPVRGELSGDAAVVDEHVNLRTKLSASPAGPIAYRTGSPDSAQAQFVWVDRSGRELDKVVYPNAAALGPALSHDGRRIAVYRYVDNNMDIWTYETSRKTWDKATFASGDDIYPIWSPDDSSIVFASARDASATVQLYRKTLSGPPNSEELLLSGPEGKFPNDWSSDGRFILYNSLGDKSGPDIWALPLEGDRKPFEVVATNFNESQGQFSPDGKWIAYQSDKTGREEIYVRPFPGPGGDTRTSTEGGIQPRWNPNGKELFYVAPDDRLMAVPLVVSSDGKTVEPGTPVALFQTDVGSTVNLKFKQQYLVTKDGQSFIMNSTVPGGIASPITVILNWKPGR
jgi:serine/threonine protein kinase